MNSEALEERLQVEFVSELIYKFMELQLSTWCALFRKSALFCGHAGDALGEMRQARVKFDEEILEGKVW